MIVKEILNFFWEIYFDVSSCNRTRLEINNCQALNHDSDVNFEVNKIVIAEDLVRGIKCSAKFCASKSTYFSGTLLIFDFHQT